MAVVTLIAFIFYIADFYEKEKRKGSKYLIILPPISLKEIGVIFLNFFIFY